MRPNRSISIKMIHAPIMRDNTGLKNSSREITTAPSKRKINAHPGKKHVPQESAKFWNIKLIMPLG